VESVHLVQGSIQWWSLVDTVTNFKLHKMRGVYCHLSDYLFSRKFLFHEFSYGVPVFIDLL
jgi:hypothetical protein